jgi:hypothetical protein
MDMNEKLSFTIFDKRFADLEDQQREFINIYTKEYYNYLGKIKDKLKEVENKRALSSHEYRLVMQWFFERIPPWCVIGGIEEGMNIANRYNKAVFSAGFFIPHIQIRFRKHKEKLNLSRRVTGLDRWYYKIFLMWKNGELGKLRFDIWEGWVRYV